MDNVEPLITITDFSLGLGPQTDILPTNKREAARAIVFNEENKIGLLYTDKHGHHKLPGGGIENDEHWVSALMREAIEELGCKVNVRDEFIGKVVEIRNQDNLFQTSYCGIADVSEYLASTELTEDEIADGLTKPKWVTIEEAFSLFKNDKPKTYLGTFMHARDTALINKAFEVLKIQKPS